MRIQHGLLLVVAAAGVLAASGQPPYGPGGGRYGIGPGRSALSNPAGQPFEMELRLMEKKAVRLQKKWKRASLQVRGWLQGIQTNAAFLNQRWKDWAEKNRHYHRGGQSMLTDRYLRSLARNNQLLKKAEKAKQASEQTQWVEAVALDMQVKADNCRYSEDGLGKVVQVKVRTTKGTNVVHGYEVWYVQNGMYGVTSAYRRFYKHSSPTDQLDLWPGYYAFWVVHDGRKEKPSRFPVGGRGQKQIELDLAVP